MNLVRRNSNSSRELDEGLDVQHDEAAWGMIEKQSHGIVVKIRPLGSILGVNQNH